MSKCALVHTSADIFAFEQFEHRAIKFAAKEGWEESTLLETATYGSLHSSRNNCLEPVTDTGSLPRHRIPL